MPEPSITAALQLIEHIRSEARARAEQHFSAGVALAKRVLPAPVFEVVSIDMRRPAGWTAAMNNMVVAFGFPESLPVCMLLNYERGSWQFECFMVLVFGWSTPHQKFRQWEDALLFATECYRHAPPQDIHEVKGMVQ